MSALRKEKISYTYEDYKTWGDETRVELINGKVYNMAAPSQRHQTIVTTSKENPAEPSSPPQMSG